MAPRVYQGRLGRTSGLLPYASGAAFALGLTTVALGAYYRKDISAAYKRYRALEDENADSTKTNSTVSTGTNNPQSGGKPNVDPQTVTPVDVEQKSADVKQTTAGVQGSILEGYKIDVINCTDNFAAITLKNTELGQTNEIIEELYLNATANPNIDFYILTSVKGLENLTTDFLPYVVKEKYAKPKNIHLTSKGNFENEGGSTFSESEQEARTKIVFCTKNCGARGAIAYLGVQIRTKESPEFVHVLSKKRLCVVK